MTRLMMTALALIPAGASACGPMAGMPAASGACAGGSGCGAMSLALMAAVAALGVWVLRSAEKDGGAVKRAGQVVGWALAVVGLGGFLCGAVNYGLKKRNQACPMPAAGSSMTLPPGHPPLAPAGK
ncbi:MAG: hypothetical protein PHS14_04355 [Elusimicrobia bacterium]|nr:hypothetical protein [Elusimicrobiota bacterium]